MDSRFEMCNALDEIEYPTAWRYGIMNRGRVDYYTTEEKAQADFDRAIKMIVERGFKNMAAAITDMPLDGNDCFHCVRRWNIRNVKKNGEPGKISETLLIVRVTEAQYMKMWRGK